MDKLVLFTLGVAILFCFAINYAANSNLRAVQSGELTLVCVMKDGERTIEPNRVVDLMDGVWIFDNGHASNCEVVKGGDL
jgi:hypothetical protein